MSTILTILVALVVMGGIAWVLRFAGQQVTNGAPFFRDMSFGVSFGYVLGVVVLAWLAWGFMQSRSSDPAIANKFFFLGVAIKGFVIFSIAAWLFRVQLEL